MFKKNFALVLLLTSTTCSFSQETTSWWKSIFKRNNAPVEMQKEGAPEANDRHVPIDPWEEPTETVADPSTLSPTNHGELTETITVVEPHGPGSYVLQSDERITQLDSAWKAVHHPVTGYRVQLFLGSLQEARIVRSKVRKQSRLPVYLSSLPPSYRVCLGDFHDKWDAEKERKKWQSKFPLNLVIPMEITIQPAEFESP